MITLLKFSNTMNLKFKSKIKNKQFLNYKIFNNLNFKLTKNKLNKMKKKLLMK